jgi:hypothetical protein
MGRWGLRGAALATGLILAGQASAQELRDLCADRPGKGTPPCILDVGHLQAEVGLGDYVRDRQDGVKTDDFTFADFELRYGLTPTLEAELAWTPYTTQRTRGPGFKSRETGVGDVGLSLRQSLMNPDGGGASIAVQPFVTAPSATHGFGAGGWAGGVVVPMSFALTSEVALAASPEVDVAPDAAGGGTHLAWGGAVGLSRAFGPVQAGVELWGSVDDDPAGTTRQASLDFTAAWIPASQPNLQLEAGVNGGLNHATPDVEVYLGVSRRY